MPQDKLDDRFVEACQMLDYVKYLAELLIAAELEQRVKIVEMLNKDGLIAGLEERLRRSEKEEVTHEEKQVASRNARLVRWKKHQRSPVL